MADRASRNVHDRRDHRVEVNHYGFPSDEAATKCDGATQEEALLRMKSLVLWMLHGPATKTTATH